MHALVQGRFVDFSRHEYFGGMIDNGTYEDLYRSPRKEWILHARPMASASEPSLRALTEDEAVAWLVELRNSNGRSPAKRRERKSVPYWIVPHDEQFRCGRCEISGPPPTGQQIELILPSGSVTAAEIESRQTSFLEPGRVLEHVMWAPAADVSATAAFRNERHDPLVARLQRTLETRLFERPRLSILQSLQDRGCDLLIDWPLRVKYGVQLKSNGDVEQDDFAVKTLAQIQDSKQHGLEKMYVILAADITGNSNQQKVRGFMSRISSMNDPYVVVVPPERAWSLLSPTAVVVSIIEQHGGSHALNFTSVSLRDCRQLSDNALAEIVTALPDLEELVLTGCEKLTDDGLSAVQRLKRLKILRLHNTLIGDRGVEYLTDLDRLELLDLDRCEKLTDNGLRCIGKILSLRELLVQITSISDAGLPFLKGLTQVKKLDLNKNKKPKPYGAITDAGLESLHPLVNLEWLNLLGTDVTDSGIKRLRQMLPNLRQVIGPEENEQAENPRKGKQQEGV